MKKILKIGVVAILLLVAFVSCSKQDEVIKAPTNTPVYDVDIPINPPWDSIPESDIPIG